MARGKLQPKRGKWRHFDCHCDCDCDRRLVVSLSPSYRQTGERGKRTKSPADQKDRQLATETVTATATATTDWK